jgi:uncharacterized protein RhaS with RHS repeats
MLLRHQVLPFLRVPIYNFYRTYDPTTGRYLEADPIGQASGVNVYSYALGAPTNRRDPRGEDILVIEGGSEGYNIFGHSSVAITGMGLFSKGTSEPLGSSTSDFVSAQASGRSQTLTWIPTSPAQDAACEKAFRKAAADPYSAVSSNCSNAVNQCLDAAGIPRGWLPDALPGSAGSRASDSGNDAWSVTLPRAFQPTHYYLPGFDPSH